MPTRLLSTREAAEALKVNPNTLKVWLRTLPIPAPRDSAGHFKFDDRALEVIEAVKSLRDHGSGYETIRRVITPMGDQQAEGQLPLFEASPQVTHDTPELVAQLMQAYRQENDLAEKYARAAHTIGQLEERVTNLTAQLDESKTRIALLEAPKRPWWRPW